MTMRMTAIEKLAGIYILSSIAIIVGWSHSYNGTITKPGTLDNEVAMSPTKQHCHRSMSSTSHVAAPSLNSGPLLRSTSPSISVGFFGPQTSVEDIRASSAHQSPLSHVLDFDVSSFYDSDLDDEYVDYDGLPQQTGTCILV
ncbi:unnamed protein product, partial [Cuscuta epithymum]